MSVLSKTILSSGVSSTFVDNVTGSVTPTNVRSQQNDMIDSLLGQIVPGTGTPAGSMVYWPGSSTTAQLILGPSGALMYAAASSPAWTPLSTISVNPTSAPQLTLNNATADAVAINLAGSSHGMQLLENATGGILKITTNGQLDFGTSNATRFTVAADGGLYAAGLASKGSGTIAANVLHAGLAGSVAGAVSINASSPTSTISLLANASGASWTMTLPASAGSNGFLLRTDGTSATSWVSGGQISGDATGAAASAGNIGEIKATSVLAVSAIALTNNAASNVASINLTAGDWDVWGTVGFTNSVSVPINQYLGAINVSSASVPSPPGSGAIAQYLFSTAISQPWLFPVGSLAIVVSTTTPIYLVSLAGFASGSTSAYGIIQARRRR